MMGPRNNTATTSTEPRDRRYGLRTERLLDVSVLLVPRVLEASTCNSSGFVKMTGQGVGARNTTRGRCRLLVVVPEPSAAHRALRWVATGFSLGVEKVG